MSSITAKEACEITEAVCTAAPVIPVLILNDIEKAFDLGSALVRGGLPALEVTLRTPNALSVIKEMSKIEGGIVGAGTLITPQDVKNAKEAGAKFGVSPGATAALIDACEAEGLPLLAGSTSASEAMALFERGYSWQKFFPAQAAGGAPFLKSLASPLPQITFCPTGGVSLENAQEYLSLSNVKCVGGSWVAPSDLIAAQDWDGIEKLALDAISKLS